MRPTCSFVNSTRSPSGWRAPPRFGITEPVRSLATETEYVRSHLAAYANDLLSLGVDGLRLDAAKRVCIVNRADQRVDRLADIPTADINSILSRLTNPVYITQEVHSASTEPTQPQAYVQNGAPRKYLACSILTCVLSSQATCKISITRPRSRTHSCRAAFLISRALTTW